VVRLHRVAIKCYDSQNWVDIIPTVLLGMRNSIKDDINTTSAELVYGCALRLPGKFITAENVYTDLGTYATKLRCWFGQLRPSSTSACGNKNIFIHKDLSNTNNFFHRKDDIKKLLERPYDGPIRRLQDNTRDVLMR